LTLVVDASVAVPACLASAGFSVLRDDDLRAPALLWSECLSVLHELDRRGEITGEVANAAREALDASPVRPVAYPDLHAEAWRIADALGWAKTYAAE
jgi:predicted nucleic acid-binding protein